ncbi:hypothetical protein EV360DRAFT_70382 [Lentinula raphanica]|nr:hypothetical protein EV360DRAFT_70382 [Lentinula raphanica]
MMIVGDGTEPKLNFAGLAQCVGEILSYRFSTPSSIPVVQLSSSPSDGPTINTPGNPPNSVSGELSAIIFESTANPVHVIARLTLTLDTLNSSWPYIANRDDAEIIRQFAGVLSNDPPKPAFIRNIRVAALFRQIMEMKGEAAPNKTLFGRQRKRRRDGVRIEVADARGGANGGPDGGAIGVVDEIAVVDGDEGAAGGAVGGVDKGAIGDTDGEASKGGDGRDGEGGEPNEPRPIEDEDERRQGDSETNDDNGERSLAERGSLSSDTGDPTTGTEASVPVETALKEAEAAGGVSANPNAVQHPKLLENTKRKHQGMRNMQSPRVCLLLSARRNGRDMQSSKIRPIINCIGSPAFLASLAALQCSKSFGHI